MPPLRFAKYFRGEVKNEVPGVFAIPSGFPFVVSYLLNRVDYCSVGDAAVSQRGIQAIVFFDSEYISKPNGNSESAFRNLSEITAFVRARTGVYHPFV